MPRFFVNRQASAPAPHNKRPRRIIVSPGQFRTTDGPALISTLLGSCVAACLYDPVSRVAGMNHFLLSNTRYSKNLPAHMMEAGKYGVNAMELLINDLLARGAERRRLQAKAFGGGSLLTNPSGDNFFCVGEVNCRFIVEFLENEKISLVGADLGGVQGRVIYFDTGDFSVYVRKIKRTVNARLYSREHRFWQERLRSQEQETTAPELWT